MSPAAGLRWLALAALLATAPAARGQELGRRGFDFSGFGAYLGGTSPTYVPFGGLMGGFVPYTPGPSGGLGVAAPMREPSARVPGAGMGAMGSNSGARLGMPSGALTPLAPIGTGSGRTGGMSGMSGLAPRAGTARPMGGMNRPPVGGYPFRQPPSLLGPSSSAPAMSM
ncbi:hypothetical protein [Aquisphaera insulae]|uniref:hypothetical protein n=1 Tax=Aquisphaera insulae TaxID=2712864 RepID=UPI0013EAE224|nr:hypothetical protein [Aquisphaera insulae]